MNRLYCKDETNAVKRGFRRNKYLVKNTSTDRYLILVAAVAVDAIEHEKRQSSKQQ